MWSTEIGRRNGSFESERARTASDHTRVTPPVVAAVRALLPQLDDHAADTGAARITEDEPGEDVPSADAGTPRRLRAARLERASALGRRRAASGRPWRCGAGAHEPYRPHNRSSEKEPTGQGVTSEEPSALALKLASRWVRVDLVPNRRVLQGQLAKPIRVSCLRAFSRSGRRDSNSGPLVPQTSALTRLRHAPFSLTRIPGRPGPRSSA